MERDNIRNEKVETFYDNFGHKLLKDYLTANQRTEGAIKYAVSQIPTSARKVLDIGCGIGWSSYEIGKRFSDAEVLAVDLSKELLNIGKSLFQLPNISFSKTDITSANFVQNESFDAIVLLDVYEHVPKSDRETFHKSVSDLLNQQGVVILSCPSTFHQNWLRTTNPDGLQPVDEDVTVDSLQKFAEDINGELTFFKYVSVWQQFDYLYAVLQKETRFDQEPLQYFEDKVVLEDPRLRIKKVEESKYASALSQEINNLRKKSPKSGNILKNILKK